MSRQDAPHVLDPEVALEERLGEVADRGDDGDDERQADDMFRMLMDSETTTDLNRLAAEGCRLTSFYAAPVCSPSSRARAVPMPCEASPTAKPRAR